MFSRDLVISRDMWRKDSGLLEGDPRRMSHSNPGHWRARCWDEPSSMAASEERTEHSETRSGHPALCLGLAEEEFLFHFLESQDVGKMFPIITLFRWFYCVLHCGKVPKLSQLTHKVALSMGWNPDQLCHWHPTAWRTREVSWKQGTILKKSHWRTSRLPRVKGHRGDGWNM